MATLLCTAAVGLSTAPPRGVICMAVPKKRRSKMKTRIRRGVWMRKARVAADKALALAKSVLTGRSNSFYYETDEPAPPTTETSCSQSDYAITEDEMRELMADANDELVNPEQGRLIPGDFHRKMELGRVFLARLLAKHFARMASLIVASLFLRR